MRSLTIRLELEKARCSGCGQTIYRFASNERWNHVIGRGDERCAFPPRPLEDAK
jgi:hypothetical protein